MLMSGDSSKEAEKEAVELAAQITFKVSYHICVTDIVTIVSCFEVITELKQTMLNAAMRMAPNKRLNNQNKGYVFSILPKFQEIEMDIMGWKISGNFCFALC